MSADSKLDGDRTRILHLALTHAQGAWVDSLESLLEPRWDVEVVAAHTSFEWVRHAVLTGQADMLLVDMGTDGHDVLAHMPAMFAAQPRLSVVGLGDSPDRDLLMAAIRAGVRGWVVPTASIDQMVRVLHGVAAGESWFPPRLMSRVLDVLLESKESREAAFGSLAMLSPRELEILRCLVHGLTRQQIAEDYFLSPHTVRTHINNVLRKLDVHSTLAAVAVARRAGLSEAAAPAAVTSDRPGTRRGARA
jgi:DNA-binding NarL/FixJ family response regulator